MHVTERTVTGVLKDEMDVEYVVRYRWVRETELRPNQLMPKDLEFMDSPPNHR